jgi:hypothetical protein
MKGELTEAEKMAASLHMTAGNLTFGDDVGRYLSVYLLTICKFLRFLQTKEKGKMQGYL